jgi:hypothetical protein
METWRADYFREWDDCLAVSASISANSDDVIVDQPKSDMVDAVRLEFISLILRRDLLFGLTNGMTISDFRGNHFDKTSEPDQRPERHRCRGCGMATETLSDGSFQFTAGGAVVVAVGPTVSHESSSVRRCN